MLARGVEPCLGSWDLGAAVCVESWTRERSNSRAGPDRTMRRRVSRVEGARFVGEEEAETLLKQADGQRP